MSRPFFALLLLVGSTCQAELINLSFETDLVLQNGVLRDANPEGPSPAPVVISNPNDPIPNSEATLPKVELAQFDLEIPGITDLEVNGPAVFSDAGGSLTVALPGGQLVQITLSEVQVSYTDRNQVISIFGEGSDFNPIPSAADVGAEDPLRLATDDAPGPEPVSIVFSARVRSSNVNTTANGGGAAPTRVVESFSARASGNISGAVLVPEPSTAALIGLLAFAVVRRRGARD